MELISILLVFTASFLELWAGISIGLGLKLNPFIVGTVAAVGSIFAAFLVLNIGDNLRERFIKWRYRGKNPEKSRYYKIWNKYGIVGLGLLSPLFFGAPLGAGLGITLGAQKKPLMIWMSIGIILWSIVLTIAGYFGLMSIQSSGYLNF